MDKKDNKELALEAAIEFTKSWISVIGYSISRVG